MTTSCYVCLFVVSILGLINCYTINRLKVQNVAVSISNNSKFRLFDTSISQMDVGEFKNLQFEKISIINDKISKYRVIGTVEAKDSNQYMKDYKEEVKKRGVLFPGFRAGKLPPAVMQDARRYIVCFGLEQLINALCNRNNLMVCTETGDDVNWRYTDPYYSTIISPKNGENFEQQRDSWKEGSDFNFEANFFSKARS